MRAEWLKVSILAPKELCGGRTVKSFRNPALRLYLAVADAILPPVGGVSNEKARCAGVMHSPPFGRTSAQHRANAKYIDIYRIID